MKTSSILFTHFCEPYCMLSDLSPRCEDDIGPSCLENFLRACSVTMVFCAFYWDYNKDDGTTQLLLIEYLLFAKPLASTFNFIILQCRFIVITLQTENVTKVKCFSLCEKADWNLNSGTMFPSLNQTERVAPLLMIDTKPPPTTWTCSYCFCYVCPFKLILGICFHHVMIIGYS